MPPRKYNLRSIPEKTYPCKRRQTSSSGQQSSSSNNNSDYCNSNNSNSNSCSTGNCSIMSNAEIAELDELVGNVEKLKVQGQNTPAAVQPAQQTRAMNAFAILEQNNKLSAANAIALRQVNQELKERIPRPEDADLIKSSLSKLLDTCQGKSETQLHDIFKAFWKEFSTKNQDRTEDAAMFLFGTATVDLMRQVDQPHVLKFAKLSLAYLRSYDNPTIKDIIADYLKPLSDTQVKKLGLTRCRRTNRTDGTVTLYYRDCVGAST